MNKKNIFSKLINFKFLVSILYFTGMLGVVVASIYHVYFLDNPVGITPTMILASISLILILSSVILAKFSKEAEEQSKNTVFIAVFSIIIVVVLLFLSGVG